MDASVYSVRRDALRRLVERHSPADYAVLTSPVSVNYFTGFLTNPYERFLALVMPISGGDAALVVPALDLAAAEAAAAVDRLIPVEDTEDPMEKLRTVIPPGKHVLGIEKRAMSVHRCESISSAYGSGVFADIGRQIDSLRQRKSKEEIGLVRQAASLTDRVLEEAVRLVRPGMAELELAAEIEYRIRTSGAQGPAFPTTVLGGRRSALPHGHSGDYRFQENDFVLIDMGLTVNGYCSDITRTFLLGEGSPRQADMYETVREAHRLAVAAAAAGTELGEIDRAARGHIDSRGYGAFFPHRVGHGLGLEVHEEPSVHGSNRDRVEPGWLFTIEPGIYVPELGGVRIEDDVWIGADGQADVLTGFPRELRRL